MAKMHELLAAEANLQGLWNGIREETLKVFDRPDAFTKLVTTKKHFEESNSHLDVTETKDLTTTVKDRLSYALTGAFVKHTDLQLQKDATNADAKADLVVGQTVIAKDIPATTLLHLEKELAQVRQMILKVPTLQAGPVWQKDENTGLYATAEAKVTFTTKKTVRPIVLVPATEHHPAQVDKVSEDIPIAKIEKHEWSGMLSSVEKAELLGRVDALLVATKKARQRANNVEVKKVRMGRSIADFILNGSLTDAEE
jgi:hypothetical protein